MTAHEPVSPFPSRFDVIGGPDFFPEDLTEELVQLADDSDVTKQLFEFDHTAPVSLAIPAAIIRAAQWADALKCPVNTAILKKYSLQDERQSDAYKPHVDPPIYSSQRIGLISLSGLAELSIMTDGDQQTVFRCLPRTALFLPPDLVHTITPPLNPSGVRHFLFLGFKSVV